VFSPGRAELSINGEVLASVPAQESPSSQIGFRGSIEDTYVDNVSVTQADGHVWSETFSRETVRKPAFAVVFAALAVLFTGVLFLAGKNVLKPLLFNLFSLYLFAALANYIDRVHFVRKYYTEPTWIERAFHKDAVGRFAENVENADDVLRRLNQTYFRDYKTENFQILFLGSSQTWGTGAAAKADVIPARFESKLRASVGGRKIFVHSAAVPGHRSWDQSDFLQLFEMKPPQMVIFNMSYNDELGADVFEENVRKIADFCKNNGTQLVLVQEAFHQYEFATKPLENHLVLERLGSELGVPVLGLHAHFKSKQNMGFIWWDNVHLTSFGMSLAADFLTEQLASQIRARIHKRN
jgi:lysophospholipase L1-like esterase